MTLPILLAFCEPGNRERVADASSAVGLYSLFVSDMGGPLLPCDRRTALILLAIGPEGGADLARWIDAHRLDGVTGIGLVGVTAPGAERQIALQDCERFEQTPLGPIEPLRAVAERARHGDECTTDGCGAVHQECPVYCDECDIGRTFALKFVVACAPDDGVCSTCDGTGRVPCNASNCIGADHECDVCDGTGKALSSAQVASELVGVDVGSTTDSMASGGTWVDVYSSNVALADHGLRSVIENLNR